MEEQHNNETSSATLCKACNQFYGSASTNYMCSCCYKKFVAQNSVPLQAFSKPAITIAPPLDEKPELQKEEVKNVSPRKQQEQCGKCGTRVGYLGYTCKCGHSYCGKHRHPDEHSCHYDFKQEAKKKLAKANPVVEHPKLQQI